MITKAIITWTTEVTIEVPEKLTSAEAAFLLIQDSYRNLPKAQPLITKCIERPDVVTLCQPSASSTTLSN